jgi:hypothetical protein
MIDLIYKWLFLLFLILILTYLVILNLNQENIIKQNDLINKNLTLISEQLQIDIITIE